MMPPNSFQQVVAADDLPARNAPSTLGSAPLPPVAELEAEYRSIANAREMARLWGAWKIYDKYSDEMMTLSGAIASARRATGGNVPVSDGANKI